MFKRKKIKVGDFVALDVCYEPKLAQVKAISHEDKQKERALLLTERGDLRSEYVFELIRIDRDDYIRLLEERAKIREGIIEEPEEEE